MLILPVEDLYTLCELVFKNAQFFYSINSCFILYCMLYIYMYIQWCNKRIFAIRASKHCTFIDKIKMKCL